MSLFGTLRRKVRQYRASTSMISGMEKASGAALNVLLLGDGIEKAYILDRLFGGNVYASKRQRKWRWQLSAMVQKSSADLVVGCNVTAAFRQHAKSATDFFLPRWVAGDVAVAVAAERARVCENIKKDKKRIRKYGLDYVLIDDPATFRWFYDTMYVPYVTNVFGEMSAQIDFSELAPCIPNSMLMLVKKDGEYVAGQVLTFEGDRARGWFGGVKNGDREWVRCGVKAAMYVFIFEELAKQGVAFYDFGGSRPFLNDGVMQFKKKWGMALNGAHSDGFYFRIIHDTSGVRAFLKNNPFVYQNTNGDLVGTIFVDTPEDQKIDSGQLKVNSFNGLSALEVYRFGGIIFPESSNLNNAKQRFVLEEAI